MKINKVFMKYFSVFLLLLTIFPLLLEVGSAGVPISLIIIGFIGCLWSLGKLYEEIQWGRVK